MKTLRLITAMVLVVGLLIGVFSAFSAEQTKQGKKEGILTDTQESKDKQKTPAPGPTTMKAPAAAVQSLPLTITRLYLKDGTVHVVIKKQGSDRLSDEDYKATKLKVEANTLIKPLEWTLLKVDPRKHLNHFRREKDFDTGLAVQDRVQVTATLYRGLWKTAKEGTLSPMMAKVDVKTRMGAPEKKDTFDDQMLVERVIPQVSAPRGVAKDFPPARSNGITVEQPRRGEVHVEGEHIQVMLRLERSLAHTLTRNVEIALENEEIGSIRYVLYSDEITFFLTLEATVDVEIPAEVEHAGFDSTYYIEVYDVEARARDEYISGRSGHFSIVSPSWGILRCNDATPTEIRVLQPDSDDIWRFPADGSSVSRYIQWQVYPAFMPVHENFELQCYTEDGRPAGELIEISSEEFFFDYEAREYTVYTDIRRFGDLEPGRYRLEVRLVPTAGDDFPAVSGRGYLFTVGETVPAALLERALADGCIQVIDPVGNTSIYAGTDLRVRWELSPDLEELIDFVRGPFGAPVVYRVWLCESEPGDRRILHIINNADARSYNVPLPHYLEGTYYVFVEVSSNSMYCGRSWRSSDTSNTFTIVRP